MFLTKAKIVTAILLSVSLLAGSAGVLTHQALASKLPAPQETTEPSDKSLRQFAAKPQATPTQEAAQDVLTIQGRVLDPDGKPVTGGQLYLSPRWPNSLNSELARYPVRATTAADGRFTFQVARSEYAALGGERISSFLQVIATAKGYGPDWAKIDPEAKSELTLRLVKDDVPLTGRVLDLQGRPVAGADVRLLALETTPEEDLTSYLKGWKTSRPQEAIVAAGKVLNRPSVVGLPQMMKTDADGRFRLTGCGRERIAMVAIEAPTIETRVVRILPRPAAEIKTVVQDASERAMPEYRRSPLLRLYGIPFDYVAGPTKLIIGTVHDKETGEPMAGVWISGSSEQRYASETSSEWRARTDAQGRYTLRGLPKSTGYRLAASPGENQGYLSRRAAGKCQRRPGSDDGRFRDGEGSGNPWPHHGQGHGQTGTGYPSLCSPQGEHPPGHRCLPECQGARFGRGFFREAGRNLPRRGCAGTGRPVGRLQSSER